jgi:hypothetical protein
VQVRSSYVITLRLQFPASFFSLKKTGFSATSLCLVRVDSISTKVVNACAVESFYGLSSINIAFSWNDYASSLNND